MRGFFGRDGRYISFKFEGELKEFLENSSLRRGDLALGDEVLRYTGKGELYVYSKYLAYGITTVIINSLFRELNSMDRDLLGESKGLLSISKKTLRF